MLSWAVIAFSHDISQRWQQFSRPIDSLHDNILSLQPLLGDQYEETGGGLSIAGCVPQTTGFARSCLHRVASAAAGHGEQPITDHPPFPIGPVPLTVVRCELTIMIRWRRIRSLGEHQTRRACVRLTSPSTGDPRPSSVRGDTIPNRGS